MIQRMKNYVPIKVKGLDLTALTDIEVSLKQGELDLLYTGENVQVGSASQLLVIVPKSVAMDLDPNQVVTGQIMYTRDGVPDATPIFPIEVRELQKESGYGD